MPIEIVHHSIKLTTPEGWRGSRYDENNKMGGGLHLQRGVSKNRLANNARLATHPMKCVDPPNRTH